MTAHELIRLLLSVGLLFKACYSDVRCRNDRGEAVDWYIVYKLPKMNDDGLSYLYMDESTNGWHLSREKIDSTTGFLAKTLKPLLDFYNRKTEGFGYILYSDQPPPPYSAPSSFGHSKGVVMLDRNFGLWLSHSTPKFPTYQSAKFWPSSGNVNAQTFFCITFPYKQFKEIGMQLKYIHAYSFDSAIPTTFYNELQCVAQRSCYPKKEPWFRVTSLSSADGSIFTSFAKYKRFGEDLYSGLIVDHMPQDIYVKSWGKMRDPLPSNCSSSLHHHVHNVKEVQLQGTEKFTDTVDHSKWCVTSDGGWICIADMNREVSQKGRGGGAICTEDTTVGTAFKKLIRKFEGCKETHHEREL
ncbi:PREDICTED: deoxyribonuclease-2-alpha-like [Cyprinodon variegatus]|uniref:deoxyribonuclease-2-alpha-like n=1 Tax=Cyprinodon variegatus TaxID=28743 RepID=UPI0007425D8F|nr:PREDICTED: deoxyribonuclease-2-alpha-like [Cyprinodon variegatus]